MANYSKRDARKKWVADMAAQAGDNPGDSPLAKCWCGKVAAIGYYPKDKVARFFCEAHKAEADALFRSGGAETGNG